MRLEFHIYFHNADKDIISKIDSIIKTLTKMPTQEQFDAAFARQSTALQNIADDIRRLTEQQSGGGLTEAQEQGILDQLNAAADQLEALAGQTPEPTVPEA